MSDIHNGLLSLRFRAHICAVWHKGKFVDWELLYIISDARIGPRRYVFLRTRIFPQGLPPIVFFVVTKCSISGYKCQAKGSDPVLPVVRFYRPNEQFLTWDVRNCNYQGCDEKESAAGFKKKPG